MHHHRSTTKTAQPKQRGASKGPRVPLKKQSLASSSKQDRLNFARQQRQAKRDELFDQFRFGTPAPKTVVLIPFHTQADTLSLKRQILAACGATEQAVAQVAPHVPMGAVLPNWAAGPHGTGKSRLLLVDPPRDIIAVLDAAKAADVVLCVLGPRASLEEPSFDNQGYKLLTVLKSQGLPIVVGAVHGPDCIQSIKEQVMQASSEERKPEVVQRKVEENLKKEMKFVSRYFTSELGEESKLFSAHDENEVKALVRHLGGVLPKDISWRADRGYVLAQDFEYAIGEQALCIRGYVRGAGFRSKRLVHITGHGDFVLGRITVLPDPLPLSERKAGAATPGERILEEMQRSELDSVDKTKLQPYDPTIAEQSHLTSEEIGEMAPPAIPNKKKMRPKKIAAPADGEDPMEGEGGEEDSSNMEADGEASDDEAMNDTASLAESSNLGTEVWGVSSEQEHQVTQETVDAERKRRRQLELTERNQEDMDFPDEVDTPIDQKARDRFQKYRGLRSFRTSGWDAYEELPVEYSRIYEFEKFDSTARSCRRKFISDCDELTYQEKEDDAEEYIVGKYCALYLMGVTPNVVQDHPRTMPFLISSMFEGETKVSVMHGTVTRNREYEEILKSKTELALHCGFRRFMSRPIFSEIPKKPSTCKKYKFLRYLHPEATACVSFYAPTMYPPCRLMMFTTGAGQPEPELIASGAVTGANPKQLIIKRVVLTGYPVRTHKSKGVVRFMFFDPTDIRWFKPVELSTRKGLRGHIVESLGTKGFMKCRFSASIKQDDIVCLNLYKRVYPKWYPPSWGGSIEDKPDENP